MYSRKRGNNMKKKVILGVSVALNVVLVLFCIILVVRLNSCNDQKDSQQRELQKKIQKLEATIDDLSRERFKEESELAEETTQSSMVAEETTSLSEEELETAIVLSQKDLEVLVNSDEPDDWLKAASSEELSDFQMYEIARKCARINGYSSKSKDTSKQLEIAYILLENPVVTKEAVRELKSSRFEQVRELAETWLENHP